MGEVEAATTSAVAAAAASAAEDEEGLEGRPGTIVWVRRRNGSWWPGRILGPAELGGSHLMSPRSGTPVKLLGREDASVDWYNLEKSKRVKAFRCGEFDACIEKAEALQGNPTRKREKYARREDAILHALELEKKHTEKKLQKLGFTSNNVDNRSLDDVKNERNNLPLDFYGGGGYNSPVDLNRRNNKRQMLKEDTSESAHRTRGLQDFGLRIAPSKRKFSQDFSWENSHEQNDSYQDILPNAVNRISSTGHSDSDKGSFDAKRKRYHGSLLQDSHVKKRDRRRPLVQVLKSSAMVPASNVNPDNGNAILSMQGERNNTSIVCRGKRSKCVYLSADSDDSVDHDGYPLVQIPQIPEIANQLASHGRFREISSSEETETTSSGLVEANDSDCSETVSSEPTIDEHDIFLPGSGRYTTSDSCAFPFQENFGRTNDDLLYGYGPLMYSQEQIAHGTGDTGVSKWHIKGKRNVRNIGKRLMDGMEEKYFPCVGKYDDGSTIGSQSGSKGSITKVGTGLSSQKVVGPRSAIKNEFSGNACDDLMDMEVNNTQQFGSLNMRYIGSARGHKRNHSTFLESEDGLPGLSSSVWEPEYPYVARKSCWGYNSRQRDEMIDVVLKVQASYHGDREHVPLVSLMSRLNGKAIVGHPIQIEILEDGYCDQFACKGDANVDESTATSAVWRTAKRTAMQRVPRANPAPSPLDIDGPECPQASDHENILVYTKGYSSHISQEARLPKKGSSQRKSLKRVSLSSQKVRTLSSLASQHGQGLGYPDTLGGLIKTEGTVPPITCIPMKVVFSRILETIGRPPSAVVHRVREPS